MGALDTTIPALAEAAGGFAPAEDLFDPAAGTLAEGVRMGANTYAQGSAPVACGRMRGDAKVANAIDEAAESCSRDRRREIEDQIRAPAAP